MNVQTLVDQIDEVQLIDVREPDEWVAGHIAGAVHLPVGDVEQRLSDIDRDRTAYVMCRSGKRSSKVTELLREKGFDAENVEGGASAWAEAGYPLVTDDGGEGVVA